MRISELITATWPSWSPGRSRPASTAAGRSAAKGCTNLRQSTFPALRRLWSNHRGVALTRYVRLKIPEPATSYTARRLSAIAPRWLGAGREGKGVDLGTGGVFFACIRSQSVEQRQVCTLRYCFADDDATCCRIQSTCTATEEEAARTETALYY